MLPSVLSVIPAFVNCFYIVYSWNCGLCPICAKLCHCNLQRSKCGCLKVLCLYIEWPAWPFLAPVRAYKFPRFWFCSVCRAISVPFAICVAEAAGLLSPLRKCCLLFCLSFQPLYVAFTLCIAETVDYVQFVQSYAIVICSVEGVAVSNFCALTLDGQPGLSLSPVRAYKFPTFWFCFVCRAMQPCRVPFVLCVAEFAGLLSPLRKCCLLFCLPFQPLYVAFTFCIAETVDYV